MPARTSHPSPPLVCLAACAVILLVCVLVAVSGCGESTTSPTTGQGSSPPPEPQWVTFATSVTYTQALRTITDLGLQPGLICDEGWEYNGQRDQFASTHGLVVVRSYASLAPDWGPQLEGNPGVVSIHDAQEALPAGTSEPTYDNVAWYICPTPAVDVARLTSAEAGAYAQVVFDASQSYDNALYTASNLGLQLVDPCYEQALLAQKSPAWHPMGQESSFAATNKLVVETRIGITPVTWQQQLSATQGVTQVITPYTAQCP